MRHELPLHLEFVTFQVVPWLELAFDQGQDLDAPQYGDSEGLPRLFKTHAWEGHCPKGTSCGMLSFVPY